MRRWDLREGSGIGSLVTNVGGEKGVADEVLGWMVSLTKRQSGGERGRYGCPEGDEELKPSSGIGGVWYTLGWVLIGRRKMQVWSSEKDRIERISTQKKLKLPIATLRFLCSSSQATSRQGTSSRRSMTHLFAILSKTSISAHEERPYEATVDVCWHIY